MGQGCHVRATRKASGLNTMDSALRAVASDGDGTMRRQGPADGGTLFAADRVSESDALGRAPAAALLAELILHGRAETPFCIGVFGAAGSGKSMFLDQVVAASVRLAAAATEAGVATPFVADCTVVRVDAARPGDPEALLASAVYERLVSTHPALAAELRHAGDDPQDAAHAAADRLTDVRRRLDAERQGLDALSGREARLAETVLETPGSAVDTYARSRRARLEGALRQFGFAVTDPVATYKGLVREASEQVGTLPRLALTLRALYAYKGQTRLLVGAVLLAVAAWLVAMLRGQQDSWLEAVRGLGEKAVPVADWMAAHVSLLGPLPSLLLLAAVLFLLLNVVRAARFVLPISRGVDLLHGDLEGRRRDLTGMIAHQTQRVDALVAQAEAAAHQASATARRVAARGDASAAEAVTPRPEALRTAESGAATILATLATAMARGGSEAPRRLLVAIDGLDARSSEDAARVVAATRRLFGPGVVTILAAGQSHLVAGFGDTDPARAMAALARCVQVPFRIATSGGAAAARRTFAKDLIEGTATAAVPPEPPDARQSVLERAWQPREAEMVAAVAPFAGDSPRAVKHFVNLYRIARADPRLAGAAPPVFTALALALALDVHGFADDLSALERASHGEAPGQSTTLREALAAARDASGTMVELAQAQRALDVAASYSSRVDL